MRAPTKNARSRATLSWKGVNGGGRRPVPPLKVDARTFCRNHEWVTSSGAPEPDPRLTSKFGKYQLLATLGQGGMADVYLAISQGPAGFHKLVVIKRLRTNLSDEPDFLEMFLDEARLAARLNHPNVVQTNEVGDVAGNYFIAMEYLEGQPLNRLMNRLHRAKRPLQPEVYLRVLCDTLAGLHHAHELKDYDGTPLSVVHRDASPHNIFVTYEGQTKLVDFGIAKAATRSFETRTGVLKGKVQYMSPEQARCTDVDRRADVFSVGVVMWELLTNMRLWKGLTDVQILERLVSGVPPSPRDFAPDVPEELEAICMKAMAIAPDDRFATAAAFREAIERYMREHEVGASPQAIGALVTEMFEDKREWLRGIVEAQLAKASKGPAAPVPILDPLTSTGTPHTLLPSHGSSPPGPMLDGTPSGIAPGVGMTSPSFSSPPVADGARERRRAAWMVIAAGGVVSVLLIAMLSMGPTDGTTTERVVGSSAAPPATTTEPTTPAAPAEARVALKVRTVPADATILLDGIPVNDNPFDGRFEKDATTHQLVVERAGYATDRRMVVFDRDLDLTIELSVNGPAKISGFAGKGGKLPPNLAAPVGPSPPPSEGTSGELTPGSTPKRELDKDDPWK